MRRAARIHRALFLSLTLASGAAAWFGCSTTPESQQTTTKTHTGSGGSGGTGGVGVDVDSGTGGSVDAGACSSTSAEAHRIPLDIVFLIDRSGSLHVEGRWTAMTSALSAFFNEPASAGIGAGLVYFPSLKADSCAVASYVSLDVPIAPLPQNAFALTNSMPAEATGVGTPTYVALKGALTTATAYQDAHPTHKVIVVLATDGDPFGCGKGTIDQIADLAKSARSYNGVLTYVVGVAGSIIQNLNQIAAAGGTTAAYDVTFDIGLFAAKMDEIRGVALGCDFSIPPSPDGKLLDPNKVNFSYTPKGIGSPKMLPRVDSIIDCGAEPGWFYDSNAAPTKIILCPASCSTVQADTNAKVDVHFGCKSLIK
jgi:hypothetical protein